MTPEQKSRQASRNANAKRITFQREYIKAKALAMERQAVIDRMGVEIGRMSGELRKRSNELDKVHAALDDADKMLRMADARAEEWRRLYIAAVDADVQRTATEQAAKDEPMPY